LTPLYKDRPGFIGIEVNSFSPGSIVADIDVIFNSTEATPTVQEIEESIADARDNAPFTILSFSTAKKNMSEDDDVMETWKIVLIVCLAVVLLILVLVSVLVSL
jgi:uncharacterized protein YpmS